MWYREGRAISAIIVRNKLKSLMSKPKGSFKKTGYSRTSRPSVRAVRNIDKGHLAEGLSRTEKSKKPTSNAQMLAVLAKVRAIIEKVDLSETDDLHMVKFLGVKDCKAVGKNICLTIEIEIMKKHPKHHPGEVKMKIKTFMLTCNPETATVSSDYKGDYKQLIEKLTQAVQKALRK